jgi:hypothetical protein
LYSREQAERERHEVQIRSEQYHFEIERLKNELISKKEIIFEKEKIIQDTQHQNREILLERQSVEERISNECKRLNELIDKYVRSIEIFLYSFPLRNRLLEDELDRMRRSQLSDRR